MRSINISNITGTHARSCVPAALSVLLDKPYDSINSWLKFRRYRSGDNWGTKTHRMDLNELGLKKIKVERTSVNQFINSHSRGKYFILVNGHALAVKNGIAYDTIDSMKKRVEDVYELVHQQQLPWDYEKAIKYFEKQDTYKIEREKAILREKKKKEAALIAKRKFKEKSKTPEFQLTQLKIRKKKWNARLKRANTMLTKIEKSIKRLEKKIEVN